MGHRISEMEGLLAAAILGVLFWPVFLTNNTNAGVDFTFVWWIALAGGFIIWRIRKRRILPEQEPNYRHIPQDVKIAVSVRDGGKCTICGSSQNLQYGHIIPYSQGGRPTIDNIKLECQLCNLRKGTKTY